MKGNRSRPPGRKRGESPFPSLAVFRSSSEPRGSGPPTAERSQFCYCRSSSLPSPPPRRLLSLFLGPSTHSSPLPGGLWRRQVPVAFILLRCPRENLGTRLRKEGLDRGADIVSSMHAQYKSFIAPSSCPAGLLLVILLPYVHLLVAVEAEKGSGKSYRVTIPNGKSLPLI